MPLHVSVQGCISVFQLLFYPRRLCLQQLPLHLLPFVNLAPCLLEYPLFLLITSCAKNIPFSFKNLLGE
ncbi:hypothetical protein DPMN_009398 [Dreissena polymorpha]|uniref:Uncharacterized protein n=1 Tax=Dreissena polymorpha TaxID=45954 RepID=A0A9D4S011_DREPO|nr:hypothetical protein DPMN_009398 [Dreissena polymorpha]